MGVTDVRPFFTQIIGHNSVNVRWIPTEVGTEIHLNEPFKCTKFQPNRSMHLCFMVDFAKVCEKKKKTKKSPNFGRSYLGNSWSDFLQIWNVDSPIWLARL